MKCLSVTQPWGSLVVTGEKLVETRSWHTPYRGVIAIHAAQGFPRWAKELVTSEEFEPSLRAHGYRGPSSLPLGSIIGFARIVDCIPTEKALEQISIKERNFGDYGPQRFAWLLADAKKLSVPTLCKGALGLWNVPEGLVLQ